jgi:putative transposase
MLCGQKIRIYPSDEQKHVFDMAFGTSRYAYNWALKEYQRLKASGREKVTMNELKKSWNDVKPEWVYNAPKDANQQPFRDLGKALKNYYNDKKSRRKHYKFPTPKKKGKCRDSFYISNDKAHITNNHITLPLCGKVALTEPLKYKRKKINIMSYTISRTADKYFLSINYEVPDHLATTKSKLNIVGIDLGLTSFITDSNGKEVPAHKSLRKRENKLKRLHRNLSRKKKGSIRRKKVRIKLARQHNKVTNTRNDFLHKLSRFIVDNYAIIATENLNIQGMLKNHKLSKAISDASWGRFMSYLEYKAAKAGCLVLKADRYFPSSKTCSHCMTVKTKEEWSLSIREYICENCGIVLPRDYNAALNILAYVLFQLIPVAYGKFTSVEIVSLCQQAIAGTNMIEEASCRSSDGRWNSEALVALLRKKVEDSIESPNIKTYKLEEVPLTGMSSQIYTFYEADS